MAVAVPTITETALIDPAIAGFLGKRSVKDDIINYDATRISPSLRAKVERLMAAKANSFEDKVWMVPGTSPAHDKGIHPLLMYAQYYSGRFCLFSSHYVLLCLAEHASLWLLAQVIYRASVAAGPLASWVKANLAYSTVLVGIAPLRKALEDVMHGLAASRQRVDQCESELGALDQQVRRAPGAQRSAKLTSRCLQNALAPATAPPSNANPQSKVLITHVMSWRLPWIVLACPQVEALRDEFRARTREAEALSMQARVMRPRH